MKSKVFKILSIALVLTLALAFVIRLAGPNLLKMYIRAGVGDCTNIPIFCMVPNEQIIRPPIDRGFLEQAVPYKSKNLSVYLPMRFTIVEEIMKKVYYKKHRRLDKGDTVYLLRKGKGFFINLFPQLARQGVGDDFEFIKRVMYARFERINSIADAFFMIMKGIFIPDLGDQRTVRMAYVETDEKKGFINYNFTKDGNFFDCNIIGKDGSFYKMYIKDRGRRLLLPEVITMVNSLDFSYKLR